MRIGSIILAAVAAFSGTTKEANNNSTHIERSNDPSKSWRNLRGLAEQSNDDYACGASVAGVQDAITCWRFSPMTECDQTIPEAVKDACNQPSDCDTSDLRIFRESAIRYMEWKNFSPESIKEMDQALRCPSA